MRGVALRDPGTTVDDLVALAVAAERAGYATVWSPEVGSRDAIVLSALYGAATGSVTVGTGVVPVYARSIAQLALSAAAASDASGGRFVLGLGAGHRFTTEMWFGQRWNDPRARLRETIEVLRRLLAGEAVDHDATFTVRGYRLATAREPVPMYIAALTPGSLRLAGEVADGVILNWLPNSGIDGPALMAREAAVDAGREIHITTYVRCAVVDDPDLAHTARAAMREQAYAYASLPAYATSLRHAGLGAVLDGLSGGGEQPLDALVDATSAVGSPDEVVQRLQAFEATALDSVVVYPVPYGDDPVASVRRTIEAAAP